MLTQYATALVTLQCVYYRRSLLGVKLSKGWGGDPVLEKFEMFPCKGTILCQRMFEVSVI